MTAHWGIPDPVAIEGTHEQKTRAFLEAALTLKRRIDLMLSLPLRSLDAIAIKREIQDIGKR
jgi:arsenate reductase